MHNAAFRALDINSLYVAFDVDPKDLEIAARAIRAMGIRGVNVTIPHKENIIFFLDEISTEASLTGAVNTVKNESSRLTGYNTDVNGFLKDINEELGFHPKGLRAALLGSGGAARAALTALAMSGASEIFLINRTLDKAKKLAAEFRKNFENTVFQAVSLDDEGGVTGSLSLADILVNSTPAGMKGIETIEIPLGSLPKGAVVYDLVYRPRETVLVKTAKESGYKASGGLGMLVYQGAESFEIWTGREAPVEIMKNAIQDAV